MCFDQHRVLFFWKQKNLKRANTPKYAKVFSGNMPVAQILKVPDNPRYPPPLKPPVIIHATYLSQIRKKGEGVGC